jgi:hypothetical protein
MIKKFALRSLLAAGLIGVALAATPRSGAANPSGPENPAGPRPDAAWAGERYAPGLRAGLNLEPVPAPLGSKQLNGSGWSGGFAWAPLTYESYRDGNWEIYTASSNGNGPLRLTNHPATDLQPRLQRGGGRIAFASDRSGNAEIFSMGQDGSDVRQLTDHPAVDRSPNWSPDGTRIAFESNRDGQYEVYGMNADGSQVTRLTDSAGFDGQPAWSPDQARIAFTTYRDGAWRIWAMNPDGSGLAQLSERAYSENPVYSPDGQWLAYDADGNLDATMEICVMPAGGGSCSYTYFPEAQTDALMRGFSPDSQLIAFTRVTWTDSAHGIAYIHSYLGEYAFFENVSLSVVSSGLDWNPDWQTMDIQAPQSIVQALPLFSRAGSIEVRWDGVDEGPTWIRNFDIQGKVGAVGAARDLWTATLSKIGDYVGSAGDVVYFRSRARDWSNNLEAWPAEWDTFTYFYKWLLEGVFTDIEGIPLDGVGLAQSIAAYEAQATRPDGTYIRHLVGEGPLSLSVTSPPGYGRLPPVQRVITGDTKLDFVLPPADNLIHNPWFDDEGLAYWQINEALPARLDTDVVHSGSGSARLDSSGLVVEPVRVMQNVGYRGDQDLHRSADGALHLFWQGGSGCVYLRRSPDGVWGAPEEIVAQSDACQAEIQPDGSLHLFYLSGGKQYYITRAPGQAWSAPEDVSNRFNGFREISFGVDSRGALHAVWEQDGFMFYNARTAAGAWSGARQVRSNGLKPILRVMADDSLYVTWEQWMMPLDASFGMKRSPDGNWGSVEALPLMCGGYYPFKQLVSDASGNLVFGCARSWDSIQFSRRDETGTWSQPEEVTTDVGETEYFSLSFELDGSLHVVWAPDTSRFGYRVRYPDGAWSEPWYHHKKWSYLRPMLAADNDAADVLWFEAGDLWQMHMDIPRSAASTLAQSVHIPREMHQPRLSFAYLVQSSNDPQARFGVDVNGLEVFATYAVTSGWKYVSADLSAYAGQDVTLTFHATSGGGAVPLRVNIDEVSIGSWRTPVVTGAEPQHWEAGLITVHGENFIATPQVYLGETLLVQVTWVDASTLTAEVPAGTPPGRQRVRVVNPDGPGSSQPVTIACGEELFLPGVWR